MPLPVVSESKLNTYSIYKPNVTIEKNETNEVFLLKNFEVRHDTIYGNLIRSEYLHSGIRKVTNHLGPFIFIPIGIWNLEQVLNFL